MAACALLAAGPAPAATLEVSGGAVLARLPDQDLRITPLPAAIRSAGGEQEAWPALASPLLEDLGDGARVTTHRGIREIWRPSTGDHRIEIGADLLHGAAATDVLVLAWSVERALTPASRLVTEVPLSLWLDAGSPDPLVVDATALRERLRPRPPAHPSPLADAICPDDRRVECDGAGNVADEQAFLDAFTGTASPGCGTVTRTLDVTPGVLEPILVFSDFSDVSAWTLNGRAGTIGNPVLDDASRRVLRLTSSFSESGSAFVSNPVPLAADSSFRAFFRFRISLPGGAADPDGLGADGMAFVVQNVANTAGGLGGGIGYQGILQSVGVEFDTWDNGAWDDFSGNHVGIDVAGNIDSIVQAPVARRMNDGDVWSAWVDYDGRSDRLEVRIDVAGVRPALPIVTTTVDLPAILGGTDAFVGFTSGTGAAYGAHDVLEFVFEAYAPVACPYRSVQSVTSTITDECGNAASCSRLFWVADTSPPMLLPAAPLTGCRQVLFAEAGPSGAPAAPTVDVIDECGGSFTVVNDRTAGGNQASDVYPCGLTSVIFEATDDCGNAARCLVIVSAVPPARPEPVGPALRVRKNAVSEPVLDWSLSAAPPGSTFTVLVSDGLPHPFPLARTGTLRSWTDLGAFARIRWYDVRTLDCAEQLSED